MKAILKIKIGTRELLKDVIRRIQNPVAALSVIGEIIHSSILSNFEWGGRPKKWKQLSNITVEKRRAENHWPGRILQVKGVSGGLLGAISYRAFNDKVVWSANKVYAAIHNYGGQAGRGLKVNIPQREFMLVQDEDWQEINDTMQDFIIMGRA